MRILALLFDIFEINIVILMKIVYNLSFWIMGLVFCSCDKSATEGTNLSDSSKLTQLSDTVGVSTYTDTDVEFVNEFGVLLPTEYRDWEQKNPANELTANWLDLQQVGDSYVLGQSNYTIERGYSECTGDSTLFVNSKNKTLLFIDSASGLRAGEVKAVNLSKNKIWPNEKLTFSFGAQTCTLRAEGKVLSTENVQTDSGAEVYKKVEDYKLYLSQNNMPEMLVLTQHSFEDTFVNILFVGDLDKDNKPDFIFSTNRNYEENRQELYLSSKAVGANLIKKVAEIVVQFDC
jgi:hypothetical protein